MRPALIQVSDVMHTYVGNFADGANRQTAASVKTHQTIGTNGPVCIVNDDEGVCDSLSVLLETYGFSVVTYGSGVAFLKDARRADAKCLIIDLHMPNLDGLDVVDELQRAGVALPTILITGKLESATAERASALGVIAVLEKPFRVMRLVDLVRGALAAPH